MTLTPIQQMKAESVEDLVLHALELLDKAAISLKAEGIEPLDHHLPNRLVAATAALRGHSVISGFHYLDGEGIRVPDCMQPIDAATVFMVDCTAGVAEPADA